MDTNILRNLKYVLDRQAQEVFVSDFYDVTVGTDKEDDMLAQALGIAISQLNGFNGQAVALFLVTALYAGLEDANWHTECGVFHDWKNRMERGESIGEILKPLLDT